MNWLCNHITELIIVWLICIILFLWFNKSFWDRIGKDTENVFSLD
jgi:hypothetical protein